MVAGHAAQHAAKTGWRLFLETNRLKFIVGTLGALSGYLLITRREYLFKGISRNFRLVYPGEPLPPDAVLISSKRMSVEDAVRMPTPRYDPNHISGHAKH